MGAQLRRYPVRPGDDGLIVRLAGLALPAAVFILGILSPQRGGLIRSHLPLFAGLLTALAAAELTAPPQHAALWRRLSWLGIELALSFAVVRAYGPPVRPSLIYLLPASRALLLFGVIWGPLLSLCVWLLYALNIGIEAWPNRLAQDLPNYLSFFLAPYVIAVALTLALLRQAGDRRRVQGLYDELSRAHEELKLLHQQAREAAVTEERNRLAREIHDTLAHYLTVINVQLEAAEKLSSLKPEQALEQVQRARRLTVECLQEVRRSVAALRASSLGELALPGALRRLTTEFAESTGIPVQLEMLLPDHLRLPAEVALALYRAAQEGLTNVQRHAHASSIDVRLAQSPAGVELEVRDNGAGPVAKAPGERIGFGLMGLRERVELVGGRVRFGPNPGSGSRLIVELPLTEAMPSDPCEGEKAAGVTS